MKKCLCCNTNINKINHYVCNECFKNVIELKKNFILLTINELKTEYNRWLRNKNITRNSKYKNEYQLKIIAIAEVFKEKYNDSSRINKIIDYSNKNITEEEIIEITKKNEEKTELDFDEHVKDENVILNDIRTYKKCDDGHRVLSIAEMTIDNWLTSKKLYHYYDKEIDDNTFWRYDFYLPEHDIYIEYWGLNDDEYLIRRKEKESYYKLHKNNRLIGIEYNNLNDLNNYLIRKLTELEPNIFEK